MGKSGAKKKKPAAAAAAAKPAPALAEPKATAPPTTPPAVNGAGPHQVVDAGVLLRRAHALKEEGNRLFQSRDYAGALRQYELALRLAPRGHPDRAVFHSNRAACLLQLRPASTTRPSPRSAPSHSRPSRASRERSSAAPARMRRSADTSSPSPTRSRSSHSTPTTATARRRCTMWICQPARPRRGGEARWREQ